MESELKLALENISNSLERVHSDLAGIKTKVDKIDERMGEHSVKIGELNKDILHIREKMVDYQLDTSKLLELQWRRIDEKIDKEKANEKFISLENRIDEKLKAQRSEMEKNIWRTLVSAMAALFLVILKFILDVMK